MWFKLIYFLRCTEFAGWIVRMMIEVTKDMLPFLFIYSVTIVAFADAFYALSNAYSVDHPGKEGFLDNWFEAIIYSYFMSLGDFGGGYDPDGGYTPTQDDSEDEPLYNLYFIIATVLNLIIMLNLLISIISDTYNSVSNQKV
jgi:hypothetical protein